MAAWTISWNTVVCDTVLATDPTIPNILSCPKHPASDNSFNNFPDILKPVTEPCPLNIEWSASLNPRTGVKDFSSPSFFAMAIALSLHAFPPAPPFK